MGDLLLCNHAIAAMPYYIEAISLNIYSLEELCYVIEHHTFLLEEDFFEDSLQSQESLPDFNFEDVLFADNSTPGKDNDGNGVGNEGSKNNNDNESNKGKDIEWSNGGARGLLYSDAIEVPQEVKEAGLIFVIEINFNVDSDGYIRNANIVKSSGNSEWDEDIRR